MKECIILAGGLGTRLQSVVNDVPKCMAEVAGKPFLEYIFNYLRIQNINHVVLALGYKHEVVLEWLSRKEFPFEISHVIEKEALGTGGAIAYAFDKIKGDNAIVINGDTFFDADLNALAAFHERHRSDISVALKGMKDFDRYGTVLLDQNKRIISFIEKQYQESGLINAGTYYINKKIITESGLPKKFSFEKEILESKLTALNIYGYESDAYFIDIGIPSDFEKANIDFCNK